MILPVVLVAGFPRWYCWSIRILCAYMVQQVAARSEYQLQSDGLLRWQRMAATQHPFRLNDANGARRQRSKPLVRADNMRLDVALWPLLSHQLHVKQVMLKGGVIQLTPQTEAAQR